MSKNRLILLLISMLFASVPYSANAYSSCPKWLHQFFSWKSVPKTPTTEILEDPVAFLQKKELKAKDLFFDFHEHHTNSGGISQVLVKVFYKDEQILEITYGALPADERTGGLVDRISTLRFPSWRRFKDKGIASVAYLVSARTIFAETGLTIFSDTNIVYPGAQFNMLSSAANSMWQRFEDIGIAQKLPRQIDGKETYYFAFKKEMLESDTLEHFHAFKTRYISED